MLRAGNSRFQFTAGNTAMVTAAAGGLLCSRHIELWSQLWLHVVRWFSLTAESYNAIATGIAQDLHQFGAISFDITTARAQLCQWRYVHRTKLPFLILQIAEPVRYGFPSGRLPLQYLRLLQL